MPRAQPLPVYLEVGRKRTFACAVDWPGWSRSAKDATQALEALSDYAARYAIVAERAGVAFPATAEWSFAVVEQVRGNATTDFGAPNIVADTDRRPVTVNDARRLALLVEAAWAVFDEVVAAAPATLRKGPRGGGRDRDDVVAHVLNVDAIHARKLGCVQKGAPRVGDHAAIATMRANMLAALATKPPGVDDGRRYLARYVMWHVLDHVWEIEDKSAPSEDAE
jgi:hypothetical protein